MRIFKNAWFSRFADKEGITDAELRETADLLESGQADAVAPPYGGANNPSYRQTARGTYANLGGGVYKVRVARSGEGKSGGYRVIVFFRSEDKTFFEYGYPKARRANIDEKELQLFKRLAKRYLAMSDEQVTNAVKASEFIEI